MYTTRSISKTEIIIKMITQNIEVNIQSGLAPYTYLFQSSDPCLTFNLVTGTTSNTVINNSYSAISADCLDNVTASVTITTADGCSVTLPIEIVNPCRDLSLTSISRISDFKFSVQATRNGCGQINIDWDYDEVIFDLVHIDETSYTSVIELKPKSGAILPDTIELTAEATDCNGCITSVTNSFAVCKPYLKSKTIYLNCIVDTNGITETFLSDYVFFDVESDCTADIDWDTISINYPEGISKYVPRTGDELPAYYTEQYIKFQGENTLTPGTYESTFTVEDENGLISNTASIFFIVGDCENETSIAIAPINYDLDCDTIAGVTTPYAVFIPFSGSVNSASDVAIDWTSFNVVSYGNIQPTYVPANCTNCVDTSGDAITLIINAATGLREIQYVLQEPIGSNAFEVTVSNIGGTIISSPSVISISGCEGFNPQAPVAANDSYCVACGSTTVLDILDNDTFYNAADLTSVVIGNAPNSDLRGYATVLANGTVSYVAPTTVAGGETTITFTYTARDSVNGESFAVPGTVTIQIICAGEDGQVTVCEY